MCLYIDAYKEKHRKGQLTSVTSYRCISSVAINNHMFFLSLNVRNPFRKLIVFGSSPSAAPFAVSGQKQSAPY